MNTFDVGALDLAKQRNDEPARVILRRGDKNATTITATITDHGDPADTTGLSARFSMRLPDMAHYYSSKFILDKVFSLEEKEGLNGHILLIHLGTVPERTDKFYNRLPRLIRSLQRRGYEFVPLQEAIR